MHRGARIGVFIAGAAVALSMGVASPGGAGGATPSLPAPQGAYHMHIFLNGGDVPYTIGVTPGACNVNGCVGSWTPNSGSYVGTYTWHASDGSVAFVLGQDHFYGRVTTAGLNTASHMGKVAVLCPKVGPKYGTWYATTG